MISKWSSICRFINETNRLSFRNKFNTFKNVRSRIIY